MIDRNKVRNEIQNKAVQELKKNNYNGTVVLPTGLGKTFVLFKAIQVMYDEDKLKDNDELIFCAERIKREETLETNANLYKELFGFDIYNTFKIRFLVYNTARTISDNEFKFVLFDEIHDGLSPENHKFLENNTIKHIIGLTATPKGYIKYSKYTKNYFYKKYCPIIYELSLNDASKVGLMREIIYYKFLSDLSIKRIFKIKYGDKQFYTSEAEAYHYWTTRINKIQEEEERTGSNMYKAKQGLYLKRKQILYRLPSKAMIFNKYMRERLTGKTLIFANSLELLAKCQIEHILSGRNKKSVNQNYIDMFNNNEIDLIGSYKIIEQGENLDRFDNMVILSYDSKIDQFIQRIGRARIANTPLKLIVHGTLGTKEINTLNTLESKMNLISNKSYNVTI